MKDSGANIKQTYFNQYGMLKGYSLNIIFLYFVTVLFFLLTFCDHSPSLKHFFVQFFFVGTFTYLCVYSLRYRVPLSGFFITLFCCILIEIIALRIWNLAVYENPLGYNPIDSAGYDDFARTFAEKRYSLGDIFDYLKKSEESFDDFGFLSVICITYKVFGADIGIYVLAVFNAIVWCLGCYILYKLALILKIGKEGRRYVSLLWGSFTYCIFTAATGLKENFFCLAIILAMYSLYKYFQYNKVRYLLLFVVGAITCSMFRIALLFILLAVFVFSSILKRKLFYKHLKLWAVLACLASLQLMPLIISYISGLRGNMAVNQGFVDAIMSGSNLIVYTGVNILSVFCGPIPNFISDIEKLNYITLWNFGTFMRFLLSGYSFYAVYYIVKHKEYVYYPLIFFIVLHSVMLVVTMFAVHDRYQMVQLPFVYVLCVYGIMKLNSAKPSTRFFFNSIYVLGATVFIIIFNILKL